VIRDVRGGGYDVPRGPQWRDRLVKKRGGKKGKGEKVLDTETGVNGKGGDGCLYLGTVTHGVKSEREKQ